MDVVRQNEDLASRFAVVGVHQKGKESLDEVRRAVEAYAAKVERSAPELLPLTVVDADVGGMFHWYGPKRLGDMVLLDARGQVAELGPSALERLQRELHLLRTRVEKAVQALEETKDPREVAEHLAAAHDSGVPAGEAAAERHAASGPVGTAPVALEAMVRRARFSVVVAAAAGKEAKRRRAALEVMRAHPSPRWGDALVELAGRRGLPAEDLCLVLRTALASIPDRPDLETRVLELGKRGDTPVRSCCMEILGKIGTPTAKARLLAVLATDPGKTTRVAAATALAEVGGADVVQALRLAADGDTVEGVRAAARRALESLAKKGSPPGG